MARVHRVVVLTDDVDRTKAFYAAAFGFVPLFDDVLPNGFRAVHIGSSAEDAGLWLMPAEPGDPRIGGRTRPEPALVIEVDDLEGTLDRIRGLGSRVVQGPDHDDSSRFAHVVDDTGTELVLVQFGSR